MVGVEDSERREPEKGEGVRGLQKEDVGQGVEEVCLI